MVRECIGDRLMKEQLVAKYNAYRSAAIKPLLEKYPGLVDEFELLAKAKRRGL